MQVQNWMSPEVITVDGETPLIEVVRLLEENHIRRLPVLIEGRLAGMITDRDVQEATPPQGRNRQGGRAPLSPGGFSTCCFN